MAITKNSGRAELITAHVDINFGDIPTTATAYDAIDIPTNAVIVGGELVIVTPWATTTTATLSVGDVTLGTRYATTASLMAAAGTRTAIAPTGFVSTLTEKRIQGTYAFTGSAATAGQARLAIQYYVKNRSNFTQG
jgi:hypothetical protein